MEIAHRREAELVDVDDDHADVAIAVRGRVERRVRSADDGRLPLEAAVDARRSGPRQDDLDSLRGRLRTDEPEPDSARDRLAPCACAPAQRVNAGPAYLTRDAQSQDRPAGAHLEVPRIEADAPRAHQRRRHLRGARDQDAGSHRLVLRRLEFRRRHDLEDEARRRPARRDGDVDCGTLRRERETLRPRDGARLAGAADGHRPEAEPVRFEDGLDLVERQPDERRQRHERRAQLALVAGEVRFLQPEDARVAGLPAGDGRGREVGAVMARVRRAGEDGDEIVRTAVVAARQPADGQAVGTDVAADVLRRLRWLQIVEQREQREVLRQHVHAVGGREEAVVPTGGERPGRGDAMDDAPRRTVVRCGNEAGLGRPHDDLDRLCELVHLDPGKSPVRADVERLGAGAEAVREPAGRRRGRDAHDEPVVARRRRCAGRHRCRSKAVAGVHCRRRGRARVLLDGSGRADGEVHAEREVLSARVLQLAGECVRAGGEGAGVVGDARAGDHRHDRGRAVECHAGRRRRLARDEGNRVDGAERGPVRRARGDDGRRGVVDAYAGHDVLRGVAEVVGDGRAEVVHAVGELRRVVGDAPRGRGVRAERLPRRAAGGGGGEDDVRRAGAAHRRVERDGAGDHAAGIRERHGRRGDVDVERDRRPDECVAGAIRDHGAQVVAAGRDGRRVPRRAERRARGRRDLAESTAAGRPQLVANRCNA